MGPLAQQASVLPLGYRPPRPDVRIYTNQAADAKSNANPTTKQHAIVMNIRLNIVSHVSYTYPKKAYETMLLRRSFYFVL